MYVFSSKDPHTWLVNNQKGATAFYFIESDALHFDI